MIIKRLGKAEAVSLALLLVSASAVWADSVTVDGDTLASSGNVSISDCSTSHSVSGQAVLAYDNSGGNPKHFKGTSAGGSATWTETVDTAGTTAGITISDRAGGALTATWAAGSTTTRTFKTNVPAGIANGSYKVTVSVSGAADPSGTITRSDFFNVVVDCTTAEEPPPPPPGDTTPPSITYTLSPASPDGDNGWYKSNVTLTWTVTEAESAGSLVKTGCVDQNITADQQATTYSCSATSDGGSAAQVDVTIKRDVTNPEVSRVGGPANGASYYFGFVPAAPTCTASDATSGLAGSATPAPSGYSTAVGTHTVTCSATDNAGNSASDSATYTVLPWTALGFYSPVDMGNFLNTVKGGSTVPLKFEAFAATELTSTSIVSFFRTKELACGTFAAATVDDVEILSTGGTSLRYDSTAGQFIQNWQTPKTAGKCYSATVGLLDGSTITAYFKTK